MDRFGTLVVHKRQCVAARDQLSAGHGNPIPVKNELAVAMTRQHQDHVP